MIVRGLLLNFMVVLAAQASPLKNCEKGEKYWCSSVKTAISCEAFNHCLGKVWLTQTPKLGCQEGQTAVKQIQLFLQTKIKELPCNGLKTELGEKCNEVTQHRVDEIVKMTAVNLHPQVMAQVLGFCTNQVAETKICTDCKVFLNDIKEEMFGDDTKNMLKSRIDALVCNQMSELNENLGNLCKKIVGDWLDSFFAMVGNQVQGSMACQFIGVCSDDTSLKQSETMARVMKFQAIKMAYKSLQTGPHEKSCTICKGIIGKVKDLLKSVDFQTAASETLGSQACKLCPKTNFEACKEMVASNIPWVFDILISEMNAVHICEDLSLCEASLTTTGVPQSAIIAKNIVLKIGQEVRIGFDQFRSKIQAQTMKILPSLIETISSNRRNKTSNGERPGKRRRERQNRRQHRKGGGPDDNSLESLFGIFAEVKGNENELTMGERIREFFDRLRNQRRNRNHGHGRRGGPDDEEIVMKNKNILQEVFEKNDMSIKERISHFIEGMKNRIHNRNHGRRGDPDDDLFKGSKLSAGQRERNRRRDRQNRRPKSRKSRRDGPDNVELLKTSKSIWQHLFEETKSSIKELLHTKMYDLSNKNGLSHRERDGSRKRHGRNTKNRRRHPRRNRGPDDEKLEKINSVDGQQKLNDNEWSMGEKIQHLLESFRNHRRNRTHHHGRRDGPDDDHLIDTSTRVVQGEERDNDMSIAERIRHFMEEFKKRIHDRTHGRREDPDQSLSKENKSSLGEKRERRRKGKRQERQRKRRGDPDDPQIVTSNKSIWQQIFLDTKQSLTNFISNKGYENKLSRRGENGQRNRQGRRNNSRGRKDRRRGGPDDDELKQTSKIARQNGGDNIDLSMGDRIRQLIENLQNRRHNRTHHGRRGGPDNNSSNLKLAAKIPLKQIFEVNDNSIGEKIKRFIEELKRRIHDRAHRDDPNKDTKRIEDEILIRPSMKVADKNDKIKLTDSTCTICTMITKEVFNVLNQKKIQEEILTSVKNICDLLPGESDDGCKDFIQKTGEAMISDILELVTPQMICNMFGLCSEKHVAKAEDIGEAPWCSICKTIEQIIIDDVEDKRIVDGISGIFRAMCSLLISEDATNMCMSLLETYENAVLAMMDNLLRTDAACEKLWVCSSNPARTSKNMLHPKILFFSPEH